MKSYNDSDEKEQVFRLLNVLEGVFLANEHGVGGVSDRNLVSEVLTLIRNYQKDPELASEKVEHYERMLNQDGIFDLAYKMRTFYKKQGKNPEGEDFHVAPDKSSKVQGSVTENRTRLPEERAGMESNMSQGSANSSTESVERADVRPVV